eukprot:Opistho-2@39678
MVAPTNNTVYIIKITADLVMAAYGTGSSKNPFQPIICVVNRYLLMVLNIGKSSVVNIISTTITPMVPMMGPIALSAKEDKNNANAETVDMASAAKPNAAR